MDFQDGQYTIQSLLEFAPDSQFQRYAWPFKATLTLDSDLLIRDASMVCPTSFGYRSCHITTEGTIEFDGYKFAESAEVEIYNYNRNYPIKKSGKSIYTLRVDQIRLNLTPEEFTTAKAQGGLKPDSVVWDHTLGNKYRIDANGDVRNLGKIWANRPEKDARQRNRFDMRPGPPLTD